MRLLLVCLLMIFATSAQASNQSLFETISEISDVSNAMGGKTYTEVTDLQCQRTNDTGKVDCRFINTHGQSLEISGATSKNLLDKLIQANATSYAGSGMGKSWYETKKIQCLAARKHAANERDFTFTYECKVELELYGQE